MADITTLTRATSKTTSLRTTVPAFIVRQFNLNNGDQLQWSLEVGGDSKMIIMVKPIKK